jgi:sulfate/thiosulfate transport system substrate-binding protein
MPAAPPATAALLRETRMEKVMSSRHRPVQVGFSAWFERGLHRAALVASFLLIGGIAVFAQSPASLLNVSYDVSRELYKEINAAFIARWKETSGQETSGQTITVNQSHGGSSRQALSVIGGLEADVVTMNQAPDIDILVERGGLVAKDWRKAFAFEAAPYTSTTVFIVRKGNPKGLKDWGDLARDGLQVIVPNPKTSGNGRYTYLAAWAYGLKASGSEAGAQAFVKALFANVPVLDGGGRGATTTFAQREIGDVLITFENEATALAKEFGEGKFEVVYPSLSVDATAPVAIVESVVAKRNSRDAAKAYLDFLFTPEAQEIIAKHHFRPSDPVVLAKYRERFPPVETFRVEDRLGGWEKVQREHFADGAIYDQIMTRR